MRPEDLILPRNRSLTPSEVSHRLREAAAKPMPDEVEAAGTAGHQIGLREEFVPALVELLQSKDHFRHEDIAAALQTLRDPKTVDALYEAAHARYEYLAYDEYFGLARKCTWALADIGTPEAKAKLTL